jgi:protein-tyrosine phosphatase
VKKAGLSSQFYIASAAVSREELGNSIYPPARRELTRHGISFDHHRARQITAEDLIRFDRIYYMDSRNARYLYQMFPKETKFRPFLPYDVADPWYSGDFAQTWEDITTGCQKILEEFQ